MESQLIGDQQERLSKSLWIYSKAQKDTPRLGRNLKSLCKLIPIAFLTIYDPTHVHGSWFRSLENRKARQLRTTHVMKKKMMQRLGSSRLEYLICLPNNAPDSQRSNLEDIMRSFVC